MVGEDLKQALKKLSLDDVLALGLGEKKVKVVASLERAGAQGIHNVIPRTENGVIESIEVDNTNGYSAPVPAQLLPTSTKRRGRPRKSDGALQNPASSSPAQISTPRVRVPRKLFDPVEATPLKQQQSSREKIPPVQTRTGQIRHSVFTSHEEMQRQAGITGVYIDPMGSERPQGMHLGRGKKSLIAVFKSNKLKNPEWLEKSRGSWIEVAAERIAAAVIEKDEDNKDAALAPTPKRKKMKPNTEEDATGKKPRRPRKNHAALDETAPLPSASNATSTFTVAHQPGYQSAYTGPSSSKHQQLADVLFSDQPASQPAANTEPAPKTSTTLPQLPQQLARTLDSQNSSQSNQSPAAQATTQQPLSQQSDAKYLAGAWQLATQPLYQSPYSSSNFKPPNPDAPSKSASPPNVEHSNCQSTTAQSTKPPDTRLNTQIRSPASAYQSPYQSQTLAAHDERLPSLPLIVRETNSESQRRPKCFVPKKIPNALLQRQETEARLQAYKSPFGPSTAVDSTTHLQSPNFPLKNRLQVLSAPHGHNATQSSSPTPIPSLSNSFRPPFTPAAQTQGSRAGPTPVHTHTSTIPASIHSWSHLIPSTPPAPYKSPYAKGTELSKPIQPAQTRDCPPRDQFSAQSTSQDSTPHQAFVTMQPGPSTEKTSTEKRKRKRADVNGHRASKQELEEPKIDKELQDSLEVAETAFVPHNVGRISAVHQEIVGNLILSDDKSTLEFRGVKNTLELVLRVSSITQHPITSMPGSNPMELRIKIKDGSDAEVVHCFIIARTNAAYQAANSMRTKLVAAIIMNQFRAGESYEVPEQISEQKLEFFKPFKCEKCGSRWKNKEGLDYHLAKSNTSCNPNFDPARRDGRKSRGRQEKNLEETTPCNTETVGKEKVATKERIPKKRRAPNAPKPQVEVSSSIEKANLKNRITKPSEYDSTSESEDSIFEWAKRHAVPGYGSRNMIVSTPEKEKPISRRYKNLPAETTILREIIEDGSRLTVTAREHLDTHDIQKTNEALNAEDEMRLRWSKLIILDLVNANGGIFPGDQGLWMAFVALWLERYPHSALLPESKVCSMTVDRLIEAGELRFLEVLCRGKGNRDVRRTIVFRPSAGPSSLIIEKLKDLIKESYPSYYVPAKFAPPEAIFAKLRAIAMRAINNAVGGEPKSSRATRGSSLFADGRGESVSTDDDNFNSGDEEDEAESERDFEEENFSEDDNLDDEYSLKPEVPKANETTKEILARKMRDRWAEVKAAGKNTLSFTGTQVNWGPEPSRAGSREPRIRTPLTKEEKERRAANAALQLQTWQPCPPFLPNSKTGAWDQTPVRVKVQRHHERKYHLPEPITFMQASDGAWSIRAFGHGVKPIYARPSRRADGNPNSGWYMNKIQTGFRPVVYPTKNMLFLPAAPSKFMLRNLDPDTTARPKRLRGKYKRRGSSSVSLSPADFGSGVGISTSTVLPNRRYTWKDGTPPRRASTLSLFESDNLDDVIFPQSITKRQTRTSARAAQPLDEVQILNFFEPKKLLSWDERNPGLDSLPQSFGLSTPNDDSLDNSPTTSKLQFVISRPVSNESDLIDGFSWTLENWIPYKSENFRLRWSGETAFEMETLPYEELMTDSEVFDYGMTRRPRAKRQRRDNGPQASLTTRSQTALPGDLQGLMGEVKDAASVLAVELAPPNDISRKRKRFVNGEMTLEDENRFIVAIIVLRTLIGGLELMVDWVIVGSLFPGFSINYLQKYWQSCQKKRETVIDELVNNFQEAFLPAYEDGLIKPIDYDHLVDYNWDKLIDWTMKQVGISLRPRKVSLPETKKQLGKKYVITESHLDANNWRETYFSLTAPVYKRMELAASVPKTLPIKANADPNCADDVEIDNLTLAKSWVRSSALTPEGDWDKEIVKTLLHRLGEELVAEALEDLVNEKVIMHRSKGRPTPNRSYEATDIFASALRKHITEKQFVEALEYKRFLDEEFRSGKHCVRSDYMANEGTLMALTSLQAKGRINLKGVGVPNNKFGLTDGAYETRKIPPERFRFEMDIYPTDSYIFNTDDEILQKLADTEPPRGGVRGELPVWIGVTDKVILDLWKRVIVGVAGTTALRAGINSEGLKRTFTPTLEEWEIRRLMEWGVGVGLFERLHESIEGWTVGEWWWLIVGRICVS